MQLRDYQLQCEAAVYEAWHTVRNVLVVLATGSGKTVLFAKIISDHVGASCAIAHRQELVGQISLALARYGVKHRIIGPSKVIRWIIQALHIIETGQSFYDPNAPCAVAGVDTLIRRGGDLKHWTQQVTLCVNDEGHHVLRENKWGKAIALFPNAKTLLVTANTERADGKGLGRHADGIVEAMVEGPTMRELIDRGYLTDYRIFAPPSDLDLNGVTIGAAGDYNRNQLKQRVQKSHIMGDVVSHYLKLAPGKLGITFATDVETATNISAKFNAAGVPAEMVCAKTPDQTRTEILRRFKLGQIKQLVNVDLFGEGFDLPAIEVVSMARPTESFNLFCQQFGRALRLLEGKQWAIIIDHVGNVQRHGLPDAYREWTLDRRERRSRSKVQEGMIPVKTCTKCTGVYEAIYKECPFCQHVPVPAARSAPEFVDGDLYELDPTTLAAMRGDIDKIDLPADTVRRKMERAGAPRLAAGGAAKQHRLRQEAQTVLREAIKWWAGYERAKGHPDSRSYRLFYHTFKVDVMTAQTLGRPEAELLASKINKTIGRVV